MHLRNLVGNMDVPPLWHYRCAKPADGEFIKWHYAKCVTVTTYVNGAWPVIKNDAIDPARLNSVCMRSTPGGLLMVVCPLCYDVQLFTEGVLQINVHYNCPGHGGTALCPGYIYVPDPSRADRSSGATCVIQ